MKKSQSRTYTFQHGGPCPNLADYAFRQKLGLISPPAPYSPSLFQSTLVCPQDDYTTLQEREPPSFLESAADGAAFFISEQNYRRMREGRIPLKRLSF
ncbi:hypothetical protein HZB00_01490 [Candidatus Woesearchaeota archaeon]|nr:hypothetical protein [Candidatus Woesearchaeota archaeon]